MPISKSLIKKISLIIATTLVISCTGGPTNIGPLGENPIPQSVTVKAGNIPVTVTAPQGFCVDRATIDENPRGVFMFLSDCGRSKTTGRSTRRPITAILTASISPSGLIGREKGLDAALKDLGNFLATPVGLFSMSKSNVDGATTIIKAKRSDRALYILVQDDAYSDEAGASKRFWRAFSEVNGRLVALSVTGYSKNDPNEERSLRIIRAFMQAMLDSNEPLQQ